MKTKRLYIKSVYCLVILLPVVLAEDCNAQPALKDVYKEYFLVGGAFNRNLVSSKDPNAVAAETQKKLAEKYAEIFSVLLRHNNDITRFTFWSVYDATSWIGGSPLLFDRIYQPKQAFDAVIKVVQADK